MDNNIKYFTIQTFQQIPCLKSRDTLECGRTGEIYWIFGARPPKPKKNSLKKKTRKNDFLNIF